MNNPRCSVCGAQLRREKVIYTQTIGDKVYLVTDVEAEVCPQCGEQYLSPDTVDKIQTLIESGHAAETRQVPVYRLPQPAP
ncbi:MAG: type II toxin-antitoxin system MqsA family antitoxin [Chloroflexota bacterium]